jgi:hypothetical protein
MNGEMPDADHCVAPIGDACRVVQAGGPPWRLVAGAASGPAGRPGVFRKLNAEPSSGPRRRK